ncbi:MAG: caspase family protein, partial [Nitrospirota bacterium]|nr:caspase family protein [Nitrospirota bacterium]
VVSFFDAQATRQAILSELGDRLPTMVGESDRVVVFFAGHGETRQFGMGSTMGYLLPVESKPTSLSATAIDMGVIRTLAQALPAKQVLFLIDVCYGGIAGQRFRSLSPLTAEYMKVITREKGRQLITAGGSDQQAIESPEWGHSAFTYFLLNGLGKGLADLNGDGIIPASELYTYLDQRVYSAAQLIGHTQRPELWRLSAEQGEFVFFPPSASSGNLLVSTGEEQVSNEQFASLQQQLEALQSQVQSLTGSNLLSTPIPPPSSTPESEVDKFFSPESKEAGEPLEEQCEKGNGEVCFHLASGYVLGSGNTKDLGRGMGLFEKGCRMEHYDSCTALGSLLWIGDGVPQDRQLALALWEFSCKHGSARACQLLRKRQSNVG